MDLTKLSDEELVELAKGKNDQATDLLISRFTEIVNTITRKYFLIGADETDLSQEGLIAMLKAIYTYNGESSFKTYVYVCVKNRIYSLIKSSKSGKNIPLNNYISLSGDIDNDFDKSRIVMNNTVGPEEEYINRESETEFKNKINAVLSCYENEVLKLYLDGLSYLSIAKKMGKTEKSVDNAIQRIRKKVFGVING
jgi:RNA polymerase sporulation-specific sigma factor